MEGIEAMRKPPSATIYMQNASMIVNVSAADYDNLLVRTLLESIDRLTQKVRTAMPLVTAFYAGFCRQWHLCTFLANIPLLAIGGFTANLGFFTFDKALLKRSFTSRPHLATNTCTLNKCPAFFLQMTMRQA